jgi:hypothetical protein
LIVLERSSIQAGGFLVLFSRIDLNIQIPLTQHEVPSVHQSNCKPNINIHREEDFWSRSDLASPAFCFSSEFHSMQLEVNDHSAKHDQFSIPFREHFQRGKGVHIFPIAATPAREVTFAPETWLGWRKNGSG